MMLLVTQELWQTPLSLPPTVAPRPSSIRGLQEVTRALVSHFHTASHKAALCTFPL